jgi:hypothetical protein
MAPEAGGGERVVELPPQLGGPLGGGLGLLLQLA